VVVVAGALGLSTSPAFAQLMMKGDDSLASVVQAAIVAAGGLPIVYVGQSSDAGQAALTAGTQQIAPMARELNGTACTTLGSAPGQQLIGLNPIVITGANETPLGDSYGFTPVTTDDCSDTIPIPTPSGAVLTVPGCGAVDGCDASSNYTFTDWRDVLALLYGGQNHNVAEPQLTAGRRNPARINCASPVRRALVNQWSALFGDITPIQSCRNRACTTLRHAFRLDDRSAATDIFAALTGLLPVPPFTTAFDPSPIFLPKPDAAAAPNPFCNAGDAPMNKGDADYLDLDPIRRSVDHQSGAGFPSRPVLEEVGEPGLPAFGGNNLDANCTIAGNTPTNSSSSSAQNLLPSQVIAGSQALVQQEMGFPGGGAAAIGPNTHVCLGVVLPISIPTNYTTGDAYFGASSSVPATVCSVDPITASTVMAYKILDTVYTRSLCPDGKTQPCRVPVDNSTGTNNFNCYLDRLVPTLLPLRDNRGFNLHPITAAGIYKRDNYLNPNIPTTGGIPAVRQNRVVTAFFRLQFNKVTQPAPTIAPDPVSGNVCIALDPTNQVGCLVKANPCSVGFMERHGLDPSPFHNFAARLGGISPTDAAIQNFMTSTTPFYPLADNLFVNRASAALPTGAEGALFTVFQNPVLIDPIIQSNGFVVIPPGVVRARGCPSGLP
jgi:hypothetical protein